MVEIRVNGYMNMEVVLSDEEQRVVVQADHTSAPLEEWMNFFLLCCQSDCSKWPDFSQGVKAGIACMYISGETDTTVFCGETLMIMQVVPDPKTCRTKGDVYTMSGDWEWYCSDFLKMCDDDVLMRYCISWASFGTKDIGIANMFKAALTKRKEVETAFTEHCISIGISDYLNEL